jgi:hypothetical protein
MPNRDLTQLERMALEAVIDDSSVKAMLEAISEICGEKAEFIRSQWQDHATARIWDAAAGHIGCASIDVRV